MKIGAHIFNLALVGVLGCANVPLHAAESWSPTKIKPMQAISLDQGDKHIVSYFINDGDVCKLALMISDPSELSDGVPDTKAARVIVGVASGRSARIDTMDAGTLSFSCENGARSMSVIERLAMDSRS